MSTARPKLTLDRIHQGVAFWIHVTPRAKHPKVAGQHGDALRIAIAAAPVKGRANAACCEALAAALQCSRRDVEIDLASKGRRKRVKLSGDPDELESKLRELAELPRVG